MTVQCCICERIRWENEWHRVSVMRGPASHTYCPPCEDEFRREILEEVNAGLGDQCCEFSSVELS